MSQVEAETGAVRAYYSWKVQNPNEALHDVMVDVDAKEKSKTVHIGWNDEAEKNAVEVLISKDTNQTTWVAPLYGAVVGAREGRNEFKLSYSEEPLDPTTDSAVQHTGNIPLFLAFLVLFVRRYPLALL